MPQSLFSLSWYRVAGVKPRLRNHAQIHRHTYRDSVWYVLQNHSTGKFHRFTPTANLIIGLMDGRRTLQEIWDLACVRLGDDMPSQDDVIKLMSDLHRADVLQSDAMPDLGELNKRREKHVRARWKQYLGNPLSLRFPLFDPDDALNRCLPLLRFMFSWFGGLVWLVAVVWALALIGVHWNTLANGVIDRVFSVENILLLWVVFPLIKLLHELGHAAATKVAGGEVHEMGVMLLVLMPIPYVDATAASAFRDKRSRVLVGAAGMLVELFIAAIAVFAWVHLDPGFERSIAYNVILVAGVSTVLFNCNPLLRYDGYYMLSDALEIPNLGQRSNDYLGYLVNRHLYGVEGATSPVSAPGEARWFLFYAIGSFIYRMFMMVAIVLLIAGKFFFIGVLLAIWAFANMLIIPLGKKISHLATSPGLAPQRRRVAFTTIAITALVAGIIFFLPAPSSTRAEGVVWAPEQSQVRANVDGFVARVLAKPGQKVAKGEVVVECIDPELEARIRLLRAQMAELNARYDNLILEKRVQAGMIDEQKAHITEALALAEKRRADLMVRSPADGVFVIEDQQNRAGRFVPRGELLAYVVDADASTVRVVVPQADSNLVAQHTEKVEIRSVSAIGRAVKARIEREVPAATDDVPSMALSLQGGGKIGLDPGKQAEPGKEKSVDKLFVLDLALPPGQLANYLGGRIYVRFEHLPEPLAMQWYRELRRAFLKRFNL